MSVATTATGSTITGEAPSGATSLASRVRDRALAHPNRVAMREKEFGIWQEVTWKSYWDTVVTVGHAFLALGIEPGDRIAIHSENRREWLYSDVATVAVRAMTVGLYPTNPPAEVGYLLSHSGAKILVAEDQEQVTRRWVIDRCLTRAHRLRGTRGIGTAMTTQVAGVEDLLKLGAEHRASFRAPSIGAWPTRPGRHRHPHLHVGDDRRPRCHVVDRQHRVAIKTLVRWRLHSPPPGPNDLIRRTCPAATWRRIFTTWFNAGAGVQSTSPSRSPRCSRTCADPAHHPVWSSAIWADLASVSIGCRTPPLSA
jgi:long-chain acyl-CoA synthetase